MEQGADVDEAGTGGPLPRWRTEVLAGISGAIPGLPIMLTLGLLAFAATGAHGAALGIPAAFVALVAGGAVMTLLGRSRMPVAAPSSATALLFGGFIATLVADPAFDLTRAADRALLLALGGACVAAAGLLQLLFGALRFGSLVRFVPHPVLAGFMNGVAILILLNQLPLLLGLPAGAWSAGAGLALAQWQPATLAVGLVTIVTVWATRRLLPQAPAVLLGLAAGMLLYEAWHAWLPALALGPRIGELAPPAARPDALLPLRTAGALIEHHGLALLTAAMLVALIGSLESVLNGRAIDDLMNWRHDPDRELLALGAANIVSGLFGGVPLAYVRARAVATVNAGGRSRRAALAGCAALAAVYLFALPWLGRVPVVVLAGVMVTVAAALADRWTRQLLVLWWSGERLPGLRASLLLVALVCAVTLALGFLAAVGIGSLLSMLLLMRALNRSLLRERCTAAERPSRRIYAAEQEAVLAPARRTIELLEIEGALFFGNADRLLALAEQGAADRSCVVLDLRRVTTIDASGALALSRLSTQLARGHVALLLAGVSAGNRHGRALQAYCPLGEPPRSDWFPDADRALEAAEQRLLVRAGLPLRPALPLARCSLMHGLDPPARQRLGAALVQRRLAAGECLFREGDPGDSLYVVTDGSISVLGTAPEIDALRHRFVSFSAGMMFGEMAMLDRGGRTADGVADEATTVHELGRAELAELQRTDPAIAAQVYTNIALHLSQRLRAASSSWRLDAR